VRIFDQLLPRVLDGRLIRPLPAEVVAQVEGADDLVE
jgi:hypothetical protein